MDERTIRRAETALDLGAAGAFGLAAAWSAAQFAVAPLFASAAGVLAYAVAFAALRQVQPAPQALAIPRFEAVPLDVPAELILTDEERVSPDAHELLLDDILPPADPGSPEWTSPGAGSALRSILPAGERGRAGRETKAAGTM